MNFPKLKAWEWGRFVHRLMLSLRVVLGWGHVEAILEEEDREKDVVEVGEQEQGMWLLEWLFLFLFSRG